MKQVALFDQASVRAILDGLEFFRDFSPDDKSRFLAVESHFVTWEPDEVLIREGTSDNSFFVLLWGSVQVTKDGAIRPLAVLEPGEFFGEVSFLTHKPRTASVIAQTKVLAIRIDPEMLQAVGPETREKIKDRIIEKLIQRLSSMNQELADLPR